MGLRIDEISERTWLIAIGLLALVIIMVLLMAWVEQRYIPGLTKQVTFGERGYLCKEVKQIGRDDFYIVNCKTLD